jgi:hypothetical protein
MNDFVAYVPKTVEENLQWRAEMYRAAARDRSYQRALRRAAWDDTLFFFRAFLWTFEARARVTDKPFCFWDNQVQPIVEADRAIDDALQTEENVTVLFPKSRAQGATLLLLGVCLKRFLRDTGFTCGLVTRNEKLVDSLTDSDTMMWRVQYFLDRLPFWMKPERVDRNVSEHTIYNQDRRSSFVGFSATQNVGRGGRRTVFILDEFGAEEWITSERDAKVLDSLRDVTNCMLIPSTFSGTTGKFWEMCEQPGKGRKVTVAWWDNPTQNRLSYVIRKEVAVASNPEEQLAVEAYLRKHADDMAILKRRGFIKDGRKRSPWYDRKCLTPGATPRGIAREQDMDARGAVGKVFDVDVLDKMKRESCRSPLWQGRPVVDPETCTLTGLIQQDDGPMKLWFRPGLDNTVPMGDYAVGSDISSGGTGEYSSNSTLCGVDMFTGQQALAYAIQGMKVHDFARVMVAVARWLRKAYLGWEASGPGETIVEKEVLDPTKIGYYNVYYRDVNPIGGKKERKPGWGNKKESDKLDLFEQLAISFADGRFEPRDAEMIEECGEYELDSGGKIVHAPSKRSGAGQEHGDRCVGAGVAWLLCTDRMKNKLDKPDARRHNPPYGSPAWQMREMDRARSRREGQNDQDFPSSTN